jgi:hypothetical protein
MQVFTYMIAICENPPVTVFDPNRKRTARGEQRQQALLRAAAAVFGRLGYHQTTTNAIATEAGVSPATLYQFFPNKKPSPAHSPRCTRAKWPRQNAQSTPKAC